MVPSSLWHRPVLMKFCAASLNIIGRPAGRGPGKETYGLGTQGTLKEERIIIGEEIVKKGDQRPTNLLRKSLYWPSPPSLSFGQS